MNPDCIRYHEIKLPVYLPDPDLKCDSCLRKSTSINNIEISSYPAQPLEQITGKKFGALVWRRLYSAEATCAFKFCINCKDYCSKASSKHSNYWPSFVLTAMRSTSPAYAKAKEILPSLIPNKIKDMWVDAIPAFQHRNQKFIDRTKELELFKNNVSSSLGGFVQMLNKYCFPDVKCPLGCWQFMDCCREIPFHHYLSMVCNEKFPDSNAKLFESSRKNWPLTDAFMKWKISPTLVMSKSEGLSILVCEDHTN